MLPTQQITPDWLLRVARRRLWYIVVPAVLGAMGAGIYAQTQPNRYRSSAIVIVTPPQVPATIVRPMVTMSLSERLPMLQQEVLSRARLERIIIDFDLYKTERSEQVMEDVLTAMRRDITVTVARASRRADGASFTLAYTSENARTAHRVTERLVGLFVDENARQRETIAEGNDQFLSAEVESARVRLEETEQKLEAYKRQYGGQLPEQLQANLTALQTMSSQAQTLAESISRDRTELLLVQRELADLSGTSTDAAGETVTADVPILATPYDAPLAKARATLEALELRLTADHPDVVRQRRIVQDLEERATQAQLQRPVSDGPSALPQQRLSQAEVSRRNRLLELRKREQLLTQQISNKQREVTTRQQQAGAYQARVESAPAREAELIRLVRDYETLKERYNTLLMRSEEAKVSSNMERRQVSEQFRIAEPPRVPERPYSPDRLRLTIMGAGAGFGLGLLLIGLLEYRDTTFRSDADVLAALALPVVAVVPTLLTSSERRMNRRRRWMLSTSGLAVLVVAGAVLYWKFGL